MNKRLVIALLIPLFFLILSCTSLDLQIRTDASDIVFKNVSLISMTNDKVQLNQSVYVSGGVIKEIGPFDTLSFPLTAEIIDAQGRFLLPGFSDMHVHTYEITDLSLFLANGVTTVRNMWGMPEHLAIRQDIKKGTLSGPHLYTTGPLTDGESGYWPGSLILTAPAEVEEYVIGIKDAGYDFIKVYDQLNDDVFFKILEVANEHSIPVAGHIPGRVDINDAISEGMHSIEHFIGYDHWGYSIQELEELIELTVQSGIWNCPTLIVLRNLEEMQHHKENFTINGIPELKYISADQLQYWENQYGSNQNYAQVKLLLKALSEKGAHIVSGTDLGNPFIVPGFSLHTEFKLMNEAGLSPYDVLQTTTINSAKMLGIEDRAGTIEVGKIADMVLLDKNPLEDITHTRSILGVMTQGKWLDNQTIQEMLEEIEQYYAELD